MKDILFNLLNNSSPYRNFIINVDRNELHICRDDAHFPMAVHLLRFDPEMEQPGYFYSERSYNENDEYVKSHKIIFQDTEYLIETELESISYYETYFHVKYNGLYGTREFVVPYDSINYIEFGLTNSITSASKIIEEYNEIQYELNKGE